MNSTVTISDLQAKTYSKRTINLFDYKKFNLFIKMKFLTHHSNYSTHYLKDQTCHSDHHFKNHLNRLIRLPINHRIIHHIKLFSIFIFICLINLTDCARVYKGKKHTTNSPVYFISAPFLPNQPINNFPPPLSSPQFSHSSNVISSVYNNLMLTSSTTKSPLMMVTKSIEQNAKVSSSNQLDTLNSFNQTAGLQASIAKYLLNASANPNSFINKFNASAPPTDRIKTKIKLKRKKLNKNSTINISQPVRTINVDFSIADLKRTFDNLKPPELDSSNVTPNRVNDQFPIDRTSLNRALLNKPSNQQFSSNHPNVSPLPARLMNRMDLSKPEATTKNSSNFLKEKPLNILGEIILNSLQSKFHNLPLRFLSNGPPSQVLLNNGLNPYIPRKKIKMKKSQNSRIINLKLNFLSNAQPIRTLINPFGINNIRKIKVPKNYLKTHLVKSIR